MIGDLWALPGPSRFLRSIVSTLESGACVVLQLPAHAPAGAREAVRGLARASDGRPWKDFSASSVSASDPYQLAASIAERISPEGSQLSNGGLAELLESLNDHIVWVEISDALAWPVWCDFLRQLRRELVALPEQDRPAFCIRVPMRVRLPDEEIGLSIKRFRGVVGKVDVQTVVREARVSQRGGCSGVAEEIAVGVAVALSGADLSLAEHLARLELRELLEPRAALVEYATMQPWIGDSSVPTWECGTLDCVDGEEVKHIASIGLSDGGAALDRAVWEGQLPALFPYIERRRLDLLRILEAMIRLPVETQYGVVSDLADLEIGPLVYLLRGRPVPRSQWLELTALRDARHQLAHLKPLGYDQIQRLIACRA